MIGKKQYLPSVDSQDYCQYQWQHKNTYTQNVYMYRASPKNPGKVLAIDTTNNKRIKKQKTGGLLYHHSIENTLLREARTTYGSLE